MDYEKKYKEALERARKCWGEYNKLVGAYENKGICEEIFPELKESEDEKIRKSLIQQFNALNTLEVWGGIKRTDIIAWLEKQGEQKPTPVLDTEIPFGAKDSELIGANYHIPEGFHAEIKGNRVFIKKGEQKSAWSEEDEMNLDWLITVCERIHYKSNPQVSPKGALILRDWLKSLKGRVQPKQEWSEEDDVVVKDVCDKLNRLSMTYVGNESIVCQEEIKWLKSLRPQSHWKPSDEQMVQLSKYCPDNMALTSLYEHLKKLKE